MIVIEYGLIVVLIVVGIIFVLLIIGKDFKIVFSMIVVDFDLVVVGI